MRELESPLSAYLENPLEFGYLEFSGSSIPLSLPRILFRLCSLGCLKNAEVWLSSSDRTCHFAAKQEFNSLKNQFRDDKLA